MAPWPYSTPAWKRLRRRKLSQTPLCELCDRAGRLAPAVAVDHIVAITRGGPAFPELGGLMSLCIRCHNAKTRHVEQLGQPHIIKGAGLDGLPVDPSHPFFEPKGYTPSRDGKLGWRERGASRARTSFKGRR
jgi:hypothetical protein